EFGSSGGTIGRSPECNWVLPDTNRYLSSRHASIDFRAGCYYIVDTSTNGVFVNDAEHPVGRGKPQRLFNGDRIRMGEYEITVEIEDDTNERLIEQNHVDPVPLAQRVEAPSEPTSEMVDAYEITGVGIEMMLTEDELETLQAPTKARDGFLEIVLEDDAADMTKTRPNIATRSPAARTPGSPPPARAAGSPAAAVPPRPPLRAVEPVPPQPASAPASRRAPAPRAAGAVPTAGRGSAASASEAASRPRGMT